MPRNKRDVSHAGRTYGKFQPGLTMNFLFEFAVIFIISISHYAIGTLNHKDAGSPDSILGELFRRWAGAMTGAAVVLLVVNNKPNGLHLTGIHPDKGAENGYAILAGLTLTLAFIFILRAVRRLFPEIRQKASLPLDTTRIWLAEALQYREWNERAAYLTLLPLEAIAETLIYRGYLVLFIGSQIRGHLPWALLSIVLTAAIRADRGWNFRTFISNLLSSAVLIGLAIATQNVLAPITAHLYYNFIVTIQAWRLMTFQGGRVHVRIYEKSERFAYGAFISVNVLLLYAATTWLLASF